MKLTTLLLGAGAVTCALACPGQEKVMQDLNAKLAKRQTATDGANRINDSDELIGDLLTVGAITPVAQTIQGIILGTTEPQSTDTYSSVLLPKGSARCAADTCCIWKWIAQDMERKFKGSSGRCNGFARAAVRLGFHDAGAWSKTTGFGGADGSFILAGEGNRLENNGLQKITAVMQDWYDDYNKYGVGMADLIQMGANVATVVCPLGPRVRSFVGRKDSSRPAAEGLLPNVFSDADTLIKLFEDKTIKAHGLTALVGAHTTSQQRFVDPSRALDPQDSTPGIWDIKFYGQTLGTVDTPKRVFKLPSDVVLSQHPKIVQEWNQFAANGQDHWNGDYAREYVRLSLLGVNNINNLTECSKVLPRAITSFRNPDQTLIDKWLAGGHPKLGSILEDATAMTNSILGMLGINVARAFVA